MIWSSIYGLSPSVLEGLYYVSYFFVPLFLINTLWEFWVRYRRALYFAKQTYVLLEIKLPREIFKSPRAMEFCIAGMWQMIGEGNWFEKYWKGMVRTHFSLEIVSIDGVVHFYIYTKKGHKNQVEANLYSQYPGIEIYEVSDYSIPFRHDPEVSTFWACEFELSKADAFPIKTYIDYGMEKDPKEEFKIDPMTPFIEFLGSLTSGHTVWMQVIIRAHRKRRLADIFGEKEDTWKEEAKKEIDKIIEKFRPKDKDKQFRMPTKGETDTITALERSVSKLPFDVGIRTIYIAENDKFNPSNIGGLTGAFRQYSYESLNGFAPTGGTTGFDDFWVDP